MLWVVLAIVVLAVVFLQPLVLPMILGFTIGAMVYFAAPMMQFESDIMLIIFCGMAGLVLGVVRSVIWLPGKKK